MTESTTPMARVRVRCTDQGIILEIAGVSFAPSIEQARDLADNMEKDPEHYALADFPDETSQIVSALRKSADIYQAYCLGVFKPGDSNGPAS